MKNDPTVQRLEERLAALEKATAKETEWIKASFAEFKVVLNLRLEGMNGLRELMRERDRTNEARMSKLTEQMFTKDLHSAYQDKTQVQISNLQISSAVIDGKASQSSTNRATVVAVGALIVAALSLLHQYLGK